MLNHAVFMGRLTSDPELKHTSSGKAITSFTVAVNRPGKQGDDTKTDFIDCVAWENTAEFITKYFCKGKMIVIDGEITSRTREDKEGGKRKYIEVNARVAYFADSKD